MTKQELLKALEPFDDGIEIKVRGYGVAGEIGIGRAYYSVDPEWGGYVGVDVSVEIPLSPHQVEIG